MWKIIMGAAAAAALALPTTAGAATVPVQSLTGDFGATNPSVTKVADGVHAGVYANGGGAGGSLFYSGANGLTLADLAELSYTITHNSSDDSPISAPYLRVFLEGDTHDVVFSPSTQAGGAPAENTANHFDVTAGTVRYDDDPGNGPDQAWADVVAAHGTETVSGIYVTTGFSGGLDLSSIQTDLTVNADTFVFNVPPADGNDGAPGLPGANGQNGQVGPQGQTGAQGQAGQVTTTTRIVREPVTITPDPAPSICQSGVRILHVANRKGERLISARAILRGKRLRVQGRTVRINLAGQAEGNFNVSITARYRSAKTGKVAVRRSTRNLSVACA